MHECVQTSASTVGYTEKDSKRQRESTIGVGRDAPEEYKAQLANCKSDLAKLEVEKVRIEDEVKKAEGEVLSLQGGGVMLREEVTTRTSRRLCPDGPAYGGEVGRFGKQNCCNWNPNFTKESSVKKKR